MANLIQTVYRCLILFAVVCWFGPKLVTAQFADTGVGCKRTEKGVGYKGQQDVAKSGNKCLSWSSATETLTWEFLIPGKPSYTFPEKNLADAVNYCRSVDNEKEPWCYTSFSPKTWEYCDVPLCSRVGCKRNANGVGYKGQQDVTKSGKKCLNWATAVLTLGGDFLNPEKPTYTFPEKKLEDAVNYCRTVDNTLEPWCYTNVSPRTWEYCDVPLCSICRITDGAEYNGKQSVSKDGNPCVNWSTVPQIASNGNNRPYLDPATIDKYFPEEKLEDSVNYCRNPDKSAVPWCFTAVGGKFEDCDIPIC